MLDNSDLIIIALTCLGTGIAAIAIACIMAARQHG